MLHYFSAMIQKIDHWVVSLNKDQWAFIGIAVVVIAFVSLRGFGKNSRL